MVNVVYCTATNDTQLVEYEKGANEIPVKKRMVLIKGGAGRARRNIITPLGVPTIVSDDDADWLEQDGNFQTMVKTGWAKLERNTSAHKDAESRVGDMEHRDGSSQLVPVDFEKAPEVAKVSDDMQPVTTKKRSKPLN